MEQIRISQHAMGRYCERVDMGASRMEARLAIEQMAKLGRARPTPRRWMAHRSCDPGTVFVYWSARPGICVIVVDRTAVTVITRQLVKSSPQRDLQGGERRPRPTEPVARWRWNGELGEAA
jgi:hypothetical protein